MKKNVLLADCPETEVTSLAEMLRFRGQPFFVKSHTANWKRTGPVSEIRRYATYFCVGFRYFLTRRSYSVIIGWQQFYALIFCFFCSCFAVKKRNMVGVLNFTYKPKKGKLSGVYRWFMHRCLSPDYLDFLHVLSGSYAEYVHREFQFPRERIFVSAFGVDDVDERVYRLAAPEGFEKKAYALALGRSNRDYDFLIRSWQGIDDPLVIISDTYRGPVPDGTITLLSHVHAEETYPWIANCGVMLIPIDDGKVCSGDTVLLTAMAMGCRILVTVPSTLAEMYVEDGRTGILIPKDSGALQREVRAALHTDRYAHLGQSARERFLENYTRQSMGRRLSEFLDQQQEWFAIL